MSQTPPSLVTCIIAYTNIIICIIIIFQLTPNSFLINFQLTPISLLVNFQLNLNKVLVKS
jgi:hypothetical protein